MDLFEQGASFCQYLFWLCCCSQPNSKETFLEFSLDEKVDTVLSLQSLTFLSNCFWLMWNQMESNTRSSIDDYAKDGVEELFTKMHSVRIANP